MSAGTRTRRHATLSLMVSLDTTNDMSAASISSQALKAAEGTIFMNDPVSSHSSCGPAERRPDTTSPQTCAARGRGNDVATCLAGVDVQGGHGR
jgi:hypothetical protein